MFRLIGINAYYTYVIVLAFFLLFNAYLILKKYITVLIASLIYIILLLCFAVMVFMLEAPGHYNIIDKIKVGINTNLSFIDLKNNDEESLNKHFKIVHWGNQVSNPSLGYNFDMALFSCMSWAALGDSAFSPADVEKIRANGLEVFRKHFKIACDEKEISENICGEFQRLEAKCTDPYGK